MQSVAGDARSKELIGQVSGIANALMAEVSKVIIGKQENLMRTTVAILSNGNMLLEDFPGLGKTMLANTFAQALGCKFKRVQFTPDLLPSDIMGTYMYDQKSGEFKLRAGPLFSNILLADEINRAPPKTQAALLEAMEEKQVTIEGITHRLPAPFAVLATQNPIEQEGTYPLPEAQMDRFLMKMSMGYPDRAEEKAILARRKLRGKDEHDVEQVANPKKVVAMQKSLKPCTSIQPSSPTSSRSCKGPERTTGSSMAHPLGRARASSSPVGPLRPSMAEITSFLTTSSRSHSRSSAIGS